MPDFLKSNQISDNSTFCHYLECRLLADTCLSLSCYATDRSRVQSGYSARVIFSNATCRSRPTAAIAKTHSLPSAASRSQVPLVGCQTSTYGLLAQIMSRNFYAPRPIQPPLPVSRYLSASAGRPVCMYRSTSHRRALET